MWFTADLHLSHRLLARMRGFDSTLAMDEFLITRWNERVKLGDTVWLLGDVSFGSRTRTAELLARLNGTIHLVRGNHDRRLKSDRFASDQVRAEIQLGKLHLVLDHFPIESWNRRHWGVVHLHGHSHGSSRPLAGRVDVGVDCHPRLAPFALEEVLARLGPGRIEPNGAGDA